MSKLVELVQVINCTNYNHKHERVSVPQFSLETIWINPKLVTLLKAAPHYKKHLLEGRFPNGLSDNHEFTYLQIQSGASSNSYVVLGGVDAVAEKLNYFSPKRLLRG